MAGPFEQIADELRRYMLAYDPEQFPLHAMEEYYAQLHPDFREIGRGTYHGKRVVFGGFQFTGMKVQIDRFIEVATRSAIAAPISLREDIDVKDLSEGHPVAWIAMLWKHRPPAAGTWFKPDPGDDLEWWARNNGGHGGWTWLNPFTDSLAMIENLGLVRPPADAEPAEGEWSIPMSKAEIARKVTGSKSARVRDIDALWGGWQTQQVSDNKWRIRLDSVDKTIRRRLEQ